MRFYTLPLAALLTLGLCGGAAMAADTMSGPAMHAMTAPQTGHTMHPMKMHAMKKRAMKMEKKHKKMAMHKMHKKAGTMAMHMKGTMASGSMTGPKAH